MLENAKYTIAELRQKCRTGSLRGCISGQVEEKIKKEPSQGKPYWELKLRDAADILILRAWEDSAAFDFCECLIRGSCVEIEGEFLINGSFGLDARRWKIRNLTTDETSALFIGTPEDIETAVKDFAYIHNLIEKLVDPRLQALCLLFLEEHGERFRRAAAARVNHHAHRGGLLKHTAQMMRSANALCTVYLELHRDLLLAGVLFHDAGKLWEMCPPELGFEMSRELRGELLGHISISIELVNALWRKLPLAQWKSSSPASEDVRLHLLHLVAAHHGELQFGSPIEPKTPEAVALHFIDNLDARLEMFAMAYAKQPEIGSGIYERVRALNTSPVRALGQLGP